MSVCLFRCVVSECGVQQSSKRSLDLRVVGRCVCVRLYVCFNIVFIKISC